MIVLYIYLIIINALGFLLMLADKYKAIKNHWRIPEATLLGVAVMGGSLGTILGMNLVRHKTKHPKFSVGLPTLLFFQVAILMAMWHFFME